MRSVIYSLILNFVLIACEKEQNSPPIADIGVFPNIADTSSYIRFDGSSSNDLETPVELLQFRWDFNGDGVWETEYRREPVAIWQFEKTGTYQPIMEVRDEGGLTSTDPLQVIIRLNFLRSSFTDPRDGTSYKTVLIDGTWWMAENLRYGVVINPDSIPSDIALSRDANVDIPVPSNITNGIGLLAVKRTTTSFGHSFNYKTMDSIANSELTKHLQYVKW